MKTRKVAVSLPEDLLDDARRAVAAGSARSVSAYVAEALAGFRHRQTLDELLAELDAGEPISAADREWAERELDRIAGPTRASG